MRERPIAENIRRIRKEKGLTQKELGKRCGTSAAMIRQYELDLRHPKLDNLNKIAKALDVKLSELDPWLSELTAKGGG